MQLPAFEIDQNGSKFYLTVLTSKQLANEEKVKPDLWTSSTPDGYQRELVAGRARQFAKFISVAGNFSPSSIVLSARGPMRFNRKEGKYGILDIPDESTLWEVDGQHRVGGLRVALRENENLDISIPTIIIHPSSFGVSGDTNERFFEAKQFVIINRTQKRVRADVSDRFIQKLTPQQRRELEVLGGEEKLAKRQKAILVTDRIDKITGSPWFEEIKHPGEEGIISASSFASSVEPILSDVEFSEMSDEELAGLLDDYWQAWKDLCPNAFDTPEDYLLLKTTGVFSLHLLFIEVAKLLRGAQKEYTKENFYELLSKMPDGNNDEFWSSNGVTLRGMGTGKKAFQELARRLYRFLLEGLQPMG
jgi:DGQHR domain-containing protein